MIKLSIFENKFLIKSSFYVIFMRKKLRKYQYNEFQFAIPYILSLNEEGKTILFLLIIKILGFSRNS